MNWSELSPNWSQIATEMLKLIGGAVTALIVGFIAWRRGWIGQRDWDVAKIRYDLFKEEQHRRLTLLAELAESVSAAGNAAHIVLLEDAAIHQLATQHNRDFNDPYKQQHYKRRGEYEQIRVEQFQRARTLSYRYGVTPPPDERHTQAHLGKVTDEWTRKWEYLLNRAHLKEPGADSELNHWTLSLISTVRDLIRAEQMILASAEPSVGLDPFRENRFETWTSSLLTKRPNPGQDD